jgi:hypothetical protein
MSLPLLNEAFRLYGNRPLRCRVCDEAFVRRGYISGYHADELMARRFCPTRDVDGYCRCGRWCPVYRIIDPILNKIFGDERSVRISLRDLAKLLPSIRAAIADAALDRRLRPLAAPKIGLRKTEAVAEEWRLAGEAIARIGVLRKELQA